MAALPTTPKRQESGASFATPQTTRVATSHIVHSSPHYTTTRRHSLYGTEDRVILDPGSRVWKVGFSGEGKPRDVFWAGEEGGKPLWSLNRATSADARDEEDKLLDARLQTCLRSVFHDSLLTDPKSRKVIVIEHPLLPLHIKDALARILFNNLQVPSISFASSHLLALLAAGRVTGLVLDAGHLEATTLPIYSSRPLFPHLSTSPLAGARLSSHLRALLLLFGTYHPPPQNLNTNAPTPAASRATRVPQAILTDAVIEDLKARCCFVGGALDSDARSAYPATAYGTDSASDAPPSESSRSESSYDHVSADLQSSSASQAGGPPSSDFSMITQSTALSTLDRAAAVGETPLQALASLYQRHSTATNLHIRVDPVQNTGTGRGTLVVPGWIRERAAEVLFEGGDVDESSVAEVILDSLLKVPVDLRKSLASSILVIGGTAMLPGFIPRLHAELVRALSQQPSAADAAARPRGRSGRPSLKPAPYDRYATLRSLGPYIAILNHPAPPAASSSRAMANAGKAPAFAPVCMAWVGGSLSGALKTGGIEVPREKWDEAEAEFDASESAAAVSPSTPRSARTVLPDWARGPLPAGAPPANARTPAAPPPPVVDVVMASPTSS